MSYTKATLWKKIKFKKLMILNKFKINKQNSSMLNSNKLKKGYGQSVP